MSLIKDETNIILIIIILTYILEFHIEKNMKF